MLSAHRDATNRLTARLARPLVRIGVRANTLTALSLVIAALAALAGYRREAYLAGAAVLGSGVLDVLDGAVARSAGTATRAGGYLDSLADRYSDFLMLLAAGLYLGSAAGWFLMSFALFGSLATSYAKARAFQDARPGEHAFPDLFERGERVPFLAAVLLLQGVAEDVGRDEPVLLLGLGLYAVLANLTVLQRMRRALGFLRETGA